MSPSLCICDIGFKSVILSFPGFFGLFHMGVREEHRLKALEIQVVRRIFGPKRQEVRICVMKSSIVWRLLFTKYD
jgi:hypothetical protein